ncbi:hypothetical protein STSP2_03133 [Anaerohalosphaera lusitana]|uniref:Uncharacterized protein n=1 Tax=Anaerohalosphaera lusitana TaxID=1936003 RepID=A0A1U9NPT4_9BACT|nr:hypothetical protein [Anaerohalosphaera lusitana]AQT69933.1 hypothetical protein STSP2_03133 [Anaerohalosphaera lusitana]
MSEVVFVSGDGHDDSDEKLRRLSRKLENASNICEELGERIDRLEEVLLEWRKCGVPIMGAELMAKTDKVLGLRKRGKG